MLAFHHMGLPTDEKQPGEEYVAETRVWVRRGLLLASSLRWSVSTGARTPVEFFKTTKGNFTLQAQNRRMVVFHGTRVPEPTALVKLLFYHPGSLCHTDTQSVYVSSSGERTAGRASGMAGCWSVSLPFNPRGQSML